MATAVASGEPVARRWRLRLPERLPNLKGKWLTAYTVVWAVLLPIALAGAARGTYIFLTVVPMWSPYGISTSDTSQGLSIDSAMTSVARAEGIRAGDLVVAIDGWTLPATGGRAAARTRVIKPDGATTSFRMRRPNGETYEAQLVRSMAYDRERFREAGINWTVAWTVQKAGVLALPVVFMGASILLFIRRRREAVPALLSIAFLVFGGIVNGADLSGMGAATLNVLSTIGTLCLFVALLVFPSGRFEPRWTLIPTFLIPPLAVLNNDQVIGSVIAVIVVLSTLTALISRYRRVGEGAERLQLRWAFLGLMVGVLFFLISTAGNAAVAAWQATDPRWIVWQFVFFQTFGTWGLGIMALGLIVSILRYRLYDADAAVGRSAAYGVLTIGFVALFTASEKVIELLGQRYMGQNIGALAGGIGAALAAVAIAPMHARTHRWAERRFQKALWRLRHGLPALVGDLRETSGVHQIAAATLDTLMDGVRARRSALIAGETLVDAREIDPSDVTQWQSRWSPPAHDGIDIDESDEIFPVRVPLEAEGHGRVGWLLLGSRPDGTLFGKAERDAMVEIAEPVARAVQVALTREEREASYERRFAELERMVAKLTAKRKPATI